MARYFITAEVDVFKALKEKYNWFGETSARLNYMIFKRAVKLDGPL
jgi:5'(3')-deoxyribonucleotidase